MINLLLLTPIMLLFFVFLKIGLIFFGGGYAVIAIMQRELVSNYHFLTNREFIDGVAISQFTPGPVAVLSTFVGYKVYGIIGALIATFAMFLPGATLMIFISKTTQN